MESELTHTNERFSILKESYEFLNIVLDNISECVLLLDKNLILRAFNDPIKTIFTNKKNENLLYKRCGEAIGCAYQIEEERECGHTSKCHSCELRIAALTSYSTKKTIHREHICKPFFNEKNEKIDKHLQFSTRLFNHDKETYIIMIIEDLSHIMELEKRSVFH